MNAPTTQQESTAIAAPAPVPLPAFDERAAFDLAVRKAKVYAASTLVPSQYQDNIPNCIIAMNMARRIGADDLMTMQNLYIVQGKPGWSAQFLIATFNQCGRFSALRYEWRGEGITRGCRAYATERESGEKIIGGWVTWDMAKAEGWTEKKGSKWQTMPDQMFQYRAAAFLIRTHAPEIAMGLQTVEELRDSLPEVDVTPAAPTKSDAVADALRARQHPQTIEAEPAAPKPSIADIVPAPATEPAPAQPETISADAAATAPLSDLFTGPTYASVMDAINKAQSVDFLDLAADMIRSVKDEGQRAELDVAARARRKELKA